MSWIKMRTGLRTHPKVVRMAAVLKADKLRVVGALHAVWSVFDEHSEDGMLDGYTLDAMDVEIGWRGFAFAMLSIGWLIEHANGIEARDYADHNGATAKRRSSETKRKNDDREADKKRTKRGHVSASDADSLRTRGEERREEKNSLSTEESNSEAVTPAGVVCRALRQAGIPGVNPSHPTLLVLIAAGATEGEFVDAAPSALGKRDPFSYLLGVVEGRRKDAAKTATQVHRGPPVETAKQRLVREMTGGLLNGETGKNAADVVEMEAANVRAVVAR